MVGRTRSERRSSAAVSGGRAHRGRQAGVNELESDPHFLTPISYIEAVSMSR
jgi:hypothetical protein